MAVSSPLLEASIEGAHGVLLSIAGGSDLGLFEINEAAALVSQAAHAEANIIFGATIDDALGDEVRVTVIAAGFDGGMPKRRSDGNVLRQGQPGADAGETRAAAQQVAGGSSGSAQGSAPARPATSFEPPRGPSPSRPSSPRQQPARQAQPGQRARPARRVVPGAAAPEPSPGAVRRRRPRRARLPEVTVAR